MWVTIHNSWGVEQTLSAARGINIRLQTMWFEIYSIFQRNNASSFHEKTFKLCWQFELEFYSKSYCAKIKQSQNTIYFITSWLEQIWLWYRLEDWNLNDYRLEIIRDRKNILPGPPGWSTICPTLFGNSLSCPCKNDQESKFFVEVYPHCRIHV